MAKGFRFVRPRFSEGWLYVAQLRSAPIRLHWSAPLGAFFFGGFRFAPGYWLGFVLVILIHELGHAFVVRQSRQTVLSVDVHGVGGVCQWTGNASPIQRAAIAWGGVWAQLVLLALAFSTTLLITPPPGFALDFADALIRGNLFLAALNLLPIAPLDGAEAWKLPKLLLARRAARKRRAAALPAPGGQVRTGHLRLVRDEQDEPLNENARKAIERAKEIASKKYLN